MNENNKMQVHGISYEQNSICRVWPTDHNINVENLNNHRWPMGNALVDS